MASFALSSSLDGAQDQYRNLRIRRIQPVERLDAGGVGQLQIHQDRGYPRGLRLILSAEDGKTPQAERAGVHPLDVTVMRFGECVEDRSRVRAVCLNQQNVLRHFPGLALIL